MSSASARSISSSTTMGSIMGWRSAGRKAPQRLYSAPDYRSSRKSRQAAGAGTSGFPACYNARFSTPARGAGMSVRESLIKTPRQLVIVLVLAFVVPIIVIILFAKLATSGRTYDEDARSPEAVAKRIKPVAEVNMGAAEPADTVLKTDAKFKEPAAAAPAVAVKVDGKKVYETTCI